MDRELITQAERSAWPTAGAFGSLSWQGGGAARYDLVGLQANWPLFDAGRVRAKVEQARAELAADEATRTGLARSVEAEIRRALLDRDDARERISTAGEGLEAAREALRLAEARHQTGGGTMFDVSDAHQALVRAESDRIDAEFEATLAEIRLASALGVPLSNLGLVPGQEERVP
jgi:outer membrane protein TolC